MPYAKPESEIVMRINYFSAGRRFVWVKGQGRKDPLRTLEDCVGRDGNFKSEQVKNTCVPRVGGREPARILFLAPGERGALREGEQEISGRKLLDPPVTPREKF